MPWSPPAGIEAAIKNLRRPKKRLKLFELEHWLMCSIVGTCLGPPDLDRVIKRHRLTFGDDVREHQMHSFFVERAAEDCPISRTMNKILDEKFARAIKLVGKEIEEAGLEALWQELCAKGHVAAGYWAFMSHSHVPTWLRNDIFGDVHMLSHFMGGYNRGNAKALWQAQQQNEQLSSKLSKTRQRAQETIAAKEQQIGELESELQETRQQLTSAYARIAKSIAPARAKPSDQRRSERRLSAARARIRSLEDQNERMRHLLDAVADVEPPASLRATKGSQVTDQASSDNSPDLAGLQLLYVGGRYHLVPHLRARAEALDASLIHHDGGQEETLKSLDGLVERADVVFCPIDCISHQACLKAKHLCKRQSKPFVPLRSSSASCFARAIKGLEADTDGLEDAGVAPNSVVNAQAEAD
ncbi:MAG: DUF2325 domain-containing protein [Pseudomonadota bacterium]